MISLQDFIEQRTNLPTPSPVALKILESIRDEEKSFHDLEKLIQADPALTARILKVANSAYYEQVNRVDSISRATAVIGTKHLENIALSFVIVNNFPDAPQGSFNINHFWKRCISNAVAAETISSFIGANNQDIFISGLLQDIGVLVMFLSDPDSYSRMLDEKRINGKNIVQIEKETFGFDHTEAGSYILKFWNLGQQIWLPVRDHHFSGSQSPGTTAQILHAADKIASIYHGTKASKKAGDIRLIFKESFAIEDRQIDKLIDEVGKKARHIIEMFDIDPGNMKPFSQIMLEANDELNRLNMSYSEVVLELKNAKQNAEHLARELKRANENLRKLTYRDSLTGLYNMRYFRKVLEVELQRSGRYKHSISLIILDLDHFTTINNTYGHPAGDHVLQEISYVISGLIRRSDIAARYGGEEFAIILPETPDSGARVFAQRLRRGIEQHIINWNETTIPVTVSIGTVSQSRVSKRLSVSELITLSDKALYRAKHNGRNRVESICLSSDLI